MATITTGNHPAALWPGVKAWFGRTYDEHMEEYSQIFDMSTSRKNYEEVIEVTGFGLAPVKDQGTSTSYDSETQGDTSRLTHVAYSLGFIVTREELDDNLYEVVANRRSKALAFSMRQTKENVAANILNRAFDSNYTGPDGVELLSTSHVTKSGTQSNHLTVAADISELAIEDLTIQIMQALNSRGLKISVMPRCLIVPPQLYYKANRILKSDLQSGTANNDTNVLRANGIFPDGIKVNHYLTDSDAWFIKTNIPEGLVHYQRVAIEMTKDNDFDTENAKAKAYERYIFGWNDFRGLFGSPGA